MLSTEDVTIGNSRAISGLSRETVRFVFIYTFDSINVITIERASKVRKDIITILCYISLYYTYVNVITYERYSRCVNQQRIKHTIRNQAFPVSSLMYLYAITIMFEIFSNMDRILSVV